MVGAISFALLPASSALAQSNIPEPEVRGEVVVPPGAQPGFHRVHRARYHRVDVRGRGIARSGPGVAVRRPSPLEERRPHLARPSAARVESCRWSAGLRSRERLIEIPGERLCPHPEAEEAARCERCRGLGFFPEPNHDIDREQRRRYHADDVPWQDLRRTGRPSSSDMTDDDQVEAEDDVH